jgi:DNA polymerase (family 10)
MDRADVAATLTEIAALLELKGESRFRVRAYQTAARVIAAHPGDLRAARSRGALAELRGLGPATQDIVGELLDTGRCRMLEDLRDQVAPGLADLLQLPGLGVARIRQIHESLHVDSLADLAEAARDGRLARLPRFGPKTAERILRGIVFLQRQAGAMLVHHARREAENLAAALRALPGVERAEIAGSVRRRCELVRDLDVVVVTAKPASALLRDVRGLPEIVEATQGGDSGIHARLDGGTTADLYVVAPPQAGFVFVRATGSVAHLALLTARAAERGMRWEDDGLHGPGGALHADTEEAVFAALGLDWIPPELREGGEEVAAAATGALPRLVTRDDLQGFLHCHSQYSDGSSGMAEWIVAATEAGYRYVGITDHSPATAFGGGLGAKDIARQHREIDAANAAADRCRILKGVEADILATGELDYTPALRRRFDFVIASVHGRHGMDGEAMTARVLRAMDDPTMTILGHPTGRLLLSREAYPMDLDRVFARAAERRVAIEINADPQRLDLDWRVLRRAVAAGVPISIGADAHGPAQMRNMDYGVGIARKGWLRADDILNTRPLDAFLAFARARRA